MKYCPTCGTKYDEEILRFCMKDGTPLLEEEEPKFVEMPSESLEKDVDDDDPGEVTVIRRNVPVPAPPVEEDFSAGTPRGGERIVVPTYEDQQQAPRTVPYQAPPKKTNTAIVVLLTIIGTVAVLGFIGGGIWLFSNRSGNANQNANVNANASQNININTNLGFDANFSFNGNTNANSNVNTNANVKTPTPTPKPSPSVTPSPSPSPTPDDDDDTNSNTRPRPTPTPLPSPTLTRPPVNGGVLNGRATSLPTPSYPPAARAAGASGLVRVQIMVDERGNVISANAVSGHPLLRSAAEAAARSSKISPSQVGGQPARTTGVLQYNFRAN